MKASLRIAIVGLAAISAWSASADAASIGLQFTDNGRDDTTDPGVLDPTESAGVVAQTNWNPIYANTTATDLVDDSGVATTTDFTLTNPVRYGTGFGNGGSDTGNQQLFSGLMLNTNAATPLTLSFTSIPYTATGYDVYVYLRNDADNRTGTISDGTTSIPYSSSTQSASFVEIPNAGGNYVRFTGNTSANLTLTLTRGDNNVGINAVQIVAVPEPGAIGLILASVGGLLSSRGLGRRRSLI
jgi:hypothetical protein